MDAAVLTLIVNGVVSLMGSLPGLIKAIQDASIPKEDKVELIARIRAAQASIPEWL